MKIFAIYGAGGYGVEIIPLLKLSKKNLDKSKILFIDDIISVSELNGYEVLSFDNFLSKYQSKENELYCTISLADPKLREMLTVKILSKNIKLFSIVSENSTIMDEVELGAGSVISPYVTLTSNISIGICFHANMYSYVAHNCKIGNYVTFAPGVKCNGNIIIGNNVYLGTGAIIFPGNKKVPLEIGDNCVITAGAIIRKSVPANTKVLEKEYG